MFNTPIVFIIFNRPDVTSIVFNSIRKLKPTKLYVIADGPRSNNSNDYELCKLTREILNEIDWECEVFKNLSEINLGCRTRVSTGLDWVFSKESKAIILEDDCLPHPSFFQYCSELLDYYENDEKISLISGFQNLNNVTNNKGSYFFSKYTHIWGWATWARTWNKYDVEMKLWNEREVQKSVLSNFTSLNSRLYWKKIFNDTYRNKNNTWDYQLHFYNFHSNKLTIQPNRNLIKNIGINREDATHTKKDDRHNLSKNEINGITFPIKHPDIIYFDSKINNNLDQFYKLSTIRFFLRLFKLEFFLDKIKNN